MKPSRFVALAACVAALAPSSVAAAAGGNLDGVYHRLRSDSAVQLDLGAAVADGHPALHSRLTLRYLQTAGLFFAYTDDFRSELTAASRAVDAGVELRPLFLPRTSYDLQRGPAWLDLLVDSFALRVGAVFGRQPGFDLRAPGLSLGLGFGLPLTSSASGPWIDASGSLRISHAHLSGAEEVVFTRDTVFALSLGWQGFLDAGLVDAGDGLVR